MLSKLTTDQIRKESKKWALSDCDTMSSIAYREGAEKWAIWKEKADVLAEALDYLMDGVSGLPALTSIEGVLIPHWNKAVDARSKYKKNLKP